MKPSFSTQTPSGKRVLWHGGDYNPEQWPRETWDDDESLMDLAGWNTATIGVFSWVSLEPEEGRYTFEWLDEIFERLARHDRSVILATPSAAPPAWMSKAYPEILRTGADGVRWKHGNRVNYCLTSPIYREKIAGMAAKLAERYGKHPALALWHISNEYGGACHCSLCEEAFRSWLHRKFEGDLGRLNHAYWTAFWSHTYTDWDQIEIPGTPRGETAVHGLTLDWQRFVTDQTIDMYLTEASVLREATPDIPLTTNFMGFYGGLNYAKFAKHVDVTSWDSYPRFTGPLTETSTWISVAMTHDVTRSVGGGAPFLLMECTPSASNWYPVMELKTPGIHFMEGMQAIAHGSDSVQYFQWRQSRGSQEKFHGAVVQHDGTAAARVFREVAEVGEALAGLADVAGSRVQAEVAIIYDWENNWALDNSCGPRVGAKGCLSAVRDHYEVFWQSGVSIDILSEDDSLDGYKLVVAPMLYLLKPGLAERLEQFVAHGGTLVTTYLTGIVDENDLCFQGGFPGPLRSLLGIWNEEIDALDPNVRVGVEVASGLGFSGGYAAREFCDLIHAEEAEVLAHYTGGFYAGRPAMTVRRYGQGEAYYVASRNDQAFHRAFLGSLIESLGLLRAIDAELPEGVTAQRRVGEQDFVFLLNCSSAPKEVLVRESGWEDALSGTVVEGAVTLGPFGARVLSAVKVGARGAGVSPA